MRDRCWVSPSTYDLGLLGTSCDARTAEQLRYPGRTMEVDANWETSEAAVHRFEGFCIHRRWLAILVPQQRDFGRDVIGRFGVP